MSLLLQERDREVLVLTLNRPEKANAINEEMNDALVVQLEVAGKDESVRAVVLAAAGTKAFSAGADLKEALEVHKRRALLVRTLVALLDFPKPLVAALQAQALGAGCMLALLADEVVAAQPAQLGMPEIRHNMPSPIGIAVIAARGGSATARRMVQGGQSIDAARALALGLVDDVVALGNLKHHTVGRARMLATFAGAAFRTNKAYINGPLRTEIEAARRMLDAA